MTTKNRWRIAHETKGLPLKNSSTRMEDVLSSLAPGQRVTARDATTNVCWQGTVDMTAAEQGLVWIHTDCGERKLIDVQEYTLQYQEETATLP